MTSGNWQVKDVSDVDVADVCQLFERVFGHAMSRALWDWKYGSGRGVGVAARSPQGRLLAHYGGTYRELRCKDHKYHGLHIGDVMVAAEGRAALSHKGPFGLVTESFFRSHVGIKGSGAVGFGFPNDRHMRLGEKLGHYSRVQGIFELNWTAKFSCEVSAKAVDWSEPAIESTMDQFCEELTSGLRGAVVPLRTYAWLKHRFANHPEHSYQAFWVSNQDSNVRLGAIFLRPLPNGAAPDGGESWELMDWIGDPIHTLSFIESARLIVFQNAGKLLRLWCSELVAEKISLSSPNLTSICSAAVTVPNPFPTMPQWWLTGGDTDFR